MFGDLLPGFWDFEPVLVCIICLYCKDTTVSPIQLIMYHVMDNSLLKTKKTKTYTHTHTHTHTKSTFYYQLSTNNSDTCSIFVHNDVQLPQSIIQLQKQNIWIVLTLYIANNNLKKKKSPWKGGSINKSVYLSVQCTLFKLNQFHIFVQS